MTHEALRTSEPQILIATRRIDPTADLVVMELNRRGVPLVRIDVGRFPAEVRLSAYLAPAGGWTGRLADEHRSIALEDIRAVYWRRPSTMTAGQVPSGPEREFAEREARLGLMGVLTSLPRVRWINDPRAVAACTKPVQLAAMAAAGLAPPMTWIGNDPREHGEFCARVGAAVSKTLGPITYTDADGSHLVLYTARVPREEFASPRVAATANLVQAESVGKRLEYRVAVVGERLFVSKLQAQDGFRYLDVRAVPDGKVAYRPGSLPADVVSAILSVTRRFGLVFAAWDLLVGADGSLHALELNPGGQWAFTPDRDAITAAIADELEDAIR